MNNEKHTCVLSVVCQKKTFASNRKSKNVSVIGCGGWI